MEGRVGQGEKKISSKESKQREVIEIAIQINTVIPVGSVLFFSRV